MSKTGWTGERLETFVYNAISTEHLHRYSIALPYVKGKTILDIACGEGYGSNLLSAEAEFVYSVDIDQPTIDRATEKYRLPNIKFMQGGADQIPLESQSVDVVISFETIEHHDRHHEMLSEIKRVLRPGGLLIMSSPEAGVSGYNPHHVKELNEAEFQELIHAYFKNASFYYQRIVMGSMIVPKASAPANFSFHEGDYEKLDQSSQIRNPVYNICLASDNEIEPHGSSFFDGQAAITQSLLHPYQNSRLRKFVLWFRTMSGLKSAHS